MNRNDRGDLNKDIDFKFGRGFTGPFFRADAARNSLWRPRRKKLPAAPPTGPSQCARSEHVPVEFAALFSPKGCLCVGSRQPTTNQPTKKQSCSLFVLCLGFFLSWDWIQECMFYPTPDPAMGSTTGYFVSNP